MTATSLTFPQEPLTHTPSTSAMVMAELTKRAVMGTLQALRRENLGLQTSRPRTQQLGSSFQAGLIAATEVHSTPLRSMSPESSGLFARIANLTRSGGASSSNRSPSTTVPHHPHSENSTRSTITNNNLNRLLQQSFRQEEQFPILQDLSRRAALTDQELLLRALLLRSQQQGSAPVVATSHTLRSEHMKPSSQSKLRYPGIPRDTRSAGCPAPLTPLRSSSFYQKGVCSSHDASSSSRHRSNEKFPATLYRMLTEVGDSSEGSDVICFSPSGSGFYIHNREVFEQVILPRYFYHGKLASFRRQLNLYGFRLVSHGKDAGAYAHEIFHRDNQRVSEMIKRK